MLRDDRNELTQPLIDNQVQKGDSEQGETDSLSVNELTLVGLGAIIGAGFFLASSISIVNAGPSVILGFLLGGFLMWQVFSALAEMSVANPTSGSFRVYAEEALGPYFGYLSGWMYWTAGVLVMSSEVTASAIFTQWWLPKVPLWVFAIVYSGLIVAVNTMGVKNFGKIESFFSIIKIIAIILFVVLGLLILGGFFTKPSGSGIQNYYQHGGFFPNGTLGLFSSMLMILLSFGGVVVTGMAASETRDPSESIPRAIRRIVLGLLGLYVSALLVLLALVPWSQISTEASPFTIVFELVNFPYAGSIMNFVILTAALSTMNAAMYAVIRVLASLAEAEEAPLFLKTRNEDGVPIYALLVSSAGLIIAIIMSFLLPDKVYEYITSAAGFIIFFNWIIILASQIKYRPLLEENFSDTLKFKMWGYPYSSWGTIILVAAILVFSSFNPDQLIGLIGGLIIISVLSIFYFIRSYN
ncbi:MULTISPECIES: amino acid permease [unclassified Candidatus Frackibacter]|uniref:amino acid permease n=1 Tax=unclassified Candidatus Frackibacter TaxID=2648818 RepID=UPI0008827F97|nr:MULTISPECIES: amino acid permease [unclassified Candidatus Frackibacter]SDC11510.1 L-asparagine transporter [Candidatus Frackibacter sp. WG11]SEM36448.1 L-asparagine transporter [Candidatus Frackibacter sp. WG12]SFL41702.1 L-asparagine transporter [Candidatus Frackibacter sp. WG13]